MIEKSNIPVIDTIAKKMPAIEEDMLHILNPKNGFDFNREEAMSCVLAKHALSPGEKFEVVHGHSITVGHAILSLLGMRHSAQA